MANGVYYVDLDIELHLDAPDLGHPELPGLWERLCAQPWSPDRFRCLDPRPDHDCPKAMYVYPRLGKRLAAHYNPADYVLSVAESDLHKALKERIATAAVGAGFEAEIEDQAPHRRRRTDVLIHGARGIMLGAEVQVSPLTKESVRRRSGIARADDITPLWATENDRAALIHQAPWALLRRMPWHSVATVAELPVLGGVRKLEMQRCGWDGSRCPDGHRGACHRFHVYWVAARTHLDDLIVRAAAGELVDVQIPLGRSSGWYWVRAEDRATYLAATGATAPEPASEQDAAAGRPLSRRALSRECTWHVDTGFRADPIGPRDSGSPVAAFATSALARPPVGPVHPAVRRGFCAAGVTPCGQSAQLYPCGWRCTDHSPAALSRLTKN